MLKLTLFVLSLVIRCCTIAFHNNNYIHYSALTKTLLNPSSVTFLEDYDIFLDSQIDFTRKNINENDNLDISSQTDANKKKEILFIHINMPKDLYVKIDTNPKTSFSTREIFHLINSRAFVNFKNTDKIYKIIFFFMMKNHIKTKSLIFEFFKFMLNKHIDSFYIHPVRKKNRLQDIEFLMTYRDELRRTLVEPFDRNFFPKYTFEYDFYKWEQFFSDLFTSFREKYIIDFIDNKDTSVLKLYENNFCEKINYLRINEYLWTSLNIRGFFRNLVIGVNSYIDDAILHSILEFLTDNTLDMITIDISKFILNLLNYLDVNLYIAKFDIIRILLLKISEITDSILILRLNFYFELKLQKIEDSAFFELINLKNVQFPIFDAYLHACMFLKDFVPNNENTGVLINFIDHYVQQYHFNYSDITKFLFLNKIYRFDHLCELVGMKTNNKSTELDFRSTVTEYDDTESFSFQDHIQNNEIYDNWICYGFFAKKTIITNVYNLTGIIDESFINIKYSILPLYVDNSKMHKNSFKIILRTPEIFFFDHQLQTFKIEKSRFDIIFRRFLRIWSMNSSSMISYGKSFLNSFSYLCITKCEIDIFSFAPSSINKITIEDSIIRYSSMINHTRKYDTFCSIYFLQCIFGPDFELTGQYDEIVIKSCQTKFNLYGNFNRLLITGISEKNEILIKNFFSISTTKHGSLSINCSTKKIIASYIIFKKINIDLQKYDKQFTECEISTEK